jgi:SRSO17 transposase
MSVAEWTGTLVNWRQALGDLKQYVAPAFKRAEQRKTAGAFIDGLLSGAERKTGWMLAEEAGFERPFRIQSLLGRSSWSAERLNELVQRYTIDALGDADGVLVIDETGFLKKGTHSVGVARQYSGTAGRIENCQIGVFLAYVSRHGYTLIDRELYLPKEWTEDSERWARVGIPPERSFMTKPALARQMLARAFGAGVPAAWVTGDSIYGDDRRLRLWLEEQGQAYVLAVSGKESVWMGFRPQRVKALLAGLPEDGWTRLSAGEGLKGPRWYDWRLMPINPPLQQGWRRWLLVRRQLDEPGKLTAFVVFAPAGTELARLVRVAGSRWAIEVVLEAAKGEVGLDEYEVRSWTGWYRHMSLAMWAHALLTVLRAAAPAGEGVEKGALLPAAANSLATFKRSRGLWSA